MVIGTLTTLLPINEELIDKRYKQLEPYDTLIISYLPLVTAVVYGRVNIRIIQTEL